MNPEIIYLDHDNEIILELHESGKNLTQAQYSAITRMTLDFDGVIVDSSVIGSGVDKPFDWSANRRLILNLRKVVPQISKSYNRVKHVVYSSENPDGIVWGFLKIIVV